MFSLVFSTLFACSDKSVDSAQINMSNCPDEVPEQYRYTWDCLNQVTDCGGSLVYRYAEGSSAANGHLQMQERWFVFDGGSHCIDTFQITGTPADEIADEYCLDCERGFAVEWALQDTQCNMDWEKTFQNEDLEEQTYTGFLMLDTHRRVTFGEPLQRYEKNVMDVSAAAKDESSGLYALIGVYGSGTAIPSTSDEAIGAPEDYQWQNSACYQ